MMGIDSQEVEMILEDPFLPKMICSFVSLGPSPPESLVKTEAFNGAPEKTPEGRDQTLQTLQFCLETSNFRRVCYEVIHTLDGFMFVFHTYI